MSDSSLPSHASVVVIGGGVMGCSTLYHLAKAGVGDALLLERNRLTSGTTWHSAAQVRALRSSKNMTELIRYSIDLYARLEEETGQATGWINKGSLSIATSEGASHPHSAAGLLGPAVRCQDPDHLRRRGEGALAVDERGGRRRRRLVARRWAREPLGPLRRPG